MKRREKMVPKRLLIALIWISSMLMLGVSYASWNAELHIEGDLTTGMMRILFKGSWEEKYLVDLVGQDRTLPLDAEVILKDEGKKAELRFKQGLPIDRLLEGDKIRVKFPLKGDENSIALIRKREIDPDRPDERSMMKPERGMLIKDGVPYMLLSDQDFMLPLEFDLYRGVETDGHKMTGILLLESTSESRQKLQQLPKTVFVNRADLQPYPNVSVEEEQLAKKVCNGIAVVYSCELSFMLDQKETPSIRRGGE
ncbi:MAG: hypothetical protein Q4A75_05835 [Peptostreptococcaceae bacterium]|nr:hypothetical protein [Peptostreptococcaceae bacterium]